MIAKTTLFPPTLWLTVMLAALAHAGPLPYPETPKNPVSETYHGVSVVDPYRWLENDGAPDVKQWTAAQNALARRYLDAIPQRSAIAKRVADLLHSEPAQRYDFQFRKQLFAMKRQPPRNQPSLVVLKPTGMLGPASLNGCTMSPVRRWKRLMSPHGVFQLPDRKSVV